MFHQLQQEFANDASFACVYITEAHAQDEWPISSSRYNPNRTPVVYNQPTTIEERIKVARDFATAFKYQIPLLVDPIDNPFEEAYAPWPIRFYVLEDERIVYLPEPKNATYDIAALRTWLLERFQRE